MDGTGIKQLATIEDGYGIKSENNTIFYCVEEGSGFRDLYEMNLNNNNKRLIDKCAFGYDIDNGHYAYINQDLKSIGFANFDGTGAKKLNVICDENGIGSIVLRGEKIFYNIMDESGNLSAHLYQIDIDGKNNIELPHFGPSNAINLVETDR